MKQGMLLFAKTYENTRTIWYNFPVEDAFWCDEKCAIVADWVTRDPIWLPDFSGVSLGEFINNYPLGQVDELLLQRRLYKCLRIILM